MTSWAGPSLGHLPTTVDVKTEWLTVGDAVSPLVANLDQVLNNTGLGTEILPDMTTTFDTFAENQVHHC